MKMVKRITAAGLSVLLAAGLSLPALAAGDAEKDETVYVVLEPDGSVRSQTVSAHLHREGGLRGFTDQSTLTAIENTHDAAAFTQNGQELVWDTDKEDVYYKGETGRQAPVSAEIAYALDGREMSAQELAGRSGRLKLTIRLTNHETGMAEVDGEQRKICTPFVTMIAAVLGEGWENVSAPDGKVTGAGKTQAAAFVCLPGVRGVLEEAGFDKLEGLENMLLDEVSIEADVTDFSAPDILIACATDPEALRENGFSGLDKLEGLEDDMDTLDGAMGELLDGADRLADGAAALDSGAAALLVGIQTLNAGAQQLLTGADSLRLGAHQLSDGASQARDGAAALQAGADGLAAGLENLQNGAGALSNGFYQLQSGSESLTAGLNALQGNSQALVDGAAQLAGGIASLYAAVGPEGQVTMGAKAFGEALTAASGNATAAVGQLPDPAAFAASPLAEDPNFQQLLAAYTGAYTAANSLAVGLGELDGNYAQILAGVDQVSQGAQALQAGANGEAGLSAGLSAYTQGVADAAAGAGQLNSGINQLGQNLPSLTGGVDQLLGGSYQLSAGAGDLSRGNAELAAGAARLAEGTDELSAGITQLLTGITALADGAGSLKDGAGQLAEGSATLRDGLAQFNDEGVSKLTTSTEKLPALKEMTGAMRDRLENYESFAGAPEGVEVSTKFVMKTASQVEAEAGADTPVEETEPEEHEGLWQRITGLFK